MIGQLSVQAALERGLDHRRQHPAVSGQPDLAGIDPGEQPVQRTRRDQLSGHRRRRVLLLVRHGHECSSRRTRDQALHREVDTPSLAREHATRPVGEASAPGQLGHSTRPTVERGTPSVE